MDTVTFSSRPKTTQELLERLKGPLINSGYDPGKKRPQNPARPSPAQNGDPSGREEKERKALLALSRRMIEKAIDGAQHVLLENVAEAAALAPFTALDDFPNVFNGFVGVITNGAENVTLPRLQVLLESFNAVLHCPQAVQCAQDKQHHKKLGLGLGRAVFNLARLLNTILEAAEDPEIQYSLLRALSAVLDAMNEVKLKGISDLKVQPLVEQLREISKQSSLRLSQMAAYALESLRGIPTDVSPWEKLGKSMLDVFGDGVKVAGAVTTMDPVKFFDGLIDAPEDVANLVKAIIDIFAMSKPLGDLSLSASTASKDAKGAIRYRPASWYMALRYSDLLIQGRQPLVLESLLNNTKFSSSKDDNFLCGLCAQLEHAVQENTDNNPVIPVLKDFLILKGRSSSSRRVHAWIQLTIPAVELPKPSWRHQLKNRFVGLFKVKTFETKVGSSRKTTGGLRDAAKLLKEAWEDCPEAKLFYADQALRNFYTDKDQGRLDVQRLDHNKCLPMAQCYINLAIVEGGEDSSNNTPAPFSTRRRLDIWEAQGASSVALPDLFKPKADETPGSIAPKRVLIRGKAGVGKSTLCKRIVFDHIHKGMWDDIVDRVIWLPLRELKGRDPWTFGLQELLLARYFSGSEDKKLLVDALCDESDENESRTLFVLDGLDEMQGDAPDILKHLAGRPRVIITTRPHAYNTNVIQKLDREVETLGFNGSQVKEYIEKVMPGQATNVHAFLDTHPTVEGLMRIPVQLDAFCYSFEANDAIRTSAPRTMTELYVVIERVIWRKDVVYLAQNRVSGTTQISEGKAQGMAWSDIKRFVQGERTALQSLGFVGMCSNMVEFSVEYLDELWDHRIKEVTKFFPAHSETPTYGALYKLSFLRTPSRSSPASSYHFLHLTYQEYFAAQYFVQHWPKSTLPEIELSAYAFLQREKYNPRYNIMWRFVAGLLHKEGLAKAKEFFQAIEDEPYDLFGLAHQRLVMHCLAEMPIPDTSLPSKADDLDGLRANLEGSLKNWFLRELMVTGSSHLASEMEFPENILLDCLRESQSDRHDESFFNKRSRSPILGAIRFRPRISPNIAMHCEMCLEGGESALSNVEALGILATHPIPEHIVPKIISVLESDSGTIKLALSHLALGLGLGEPKLPDAILLKVVDFLKEPVSAFISACRILRLHKRLPKLAIAQILDVLQQSSFGTSSIDTDKVVEILSSQRSLEVDVLEKILDMVLTANTESGRKSMRSLEMVLQERPTLPSSVKRRLLGGLLDSNESMQRAAAGVLSHYCVRSGMLTELLVLLKDPQPKNRDAAASFLADHELEFPADVLEELSALLDDPEKRGAAMRALERQPTVPLNALKHVLDHFRHTRDHLSCTILQNQRSIPDEILAEMLNLLQSQDREIQDGIAHVLYQKTRLPDTFLNQIAVSLDARDQETKRHATFILSYQSNLKRDVLDKIFVKESLRETAARAVANRSDISTDLLLKVVALLADPSKITRGMAISALKNYNPALPNEIVEAVAKHLESPEEKIIQAALRVLGQVPPDLPLGVLIHVASLLPKKEFQETTIVDAIYVLKANKSALPEQVLSFLVDVLPAEHAHPLLVNMATGILEMQPSMPEGVIQKTITLLKHPEGKIRHSACKILDSYTFMSDDRFAELLDGIEHLSFKRLYERWVWLSFRKEMVWQADTNGTSVIRFPGGSREITLDNKMREAIREVREEMRFPDQNFGTVLDPKPHQIHPV
ncbi:hypothetical protein PG989_004479 [Apiospora arundinis]